MPFIVNTTCVLGRSQTYSANLGNTGQVCVNCVSIMIGTKAGCCSTGSSNVAIGSCAGANFLSGSENISIGWGAAYNFYNTTGDRNISIGLRAGSRSGAANGSAFDNIALGYCAAGCTYSDCRSIYIGAEAGTGLFGLNVVTRCSILIGCRAGICGDCMCGTVIIGDICPTSRTTANGLYIGQANVTRIFGRWDGKIGFCHTAPALAATVCGAIFATGEVIAYYSDRRLKDNIIVINCALDKVSKLNGVTYNPNALAKQYGFDNSKKEIGLLADEVEEQLPEVVQLAPFDYNGEKQSKSNENYKTVNYEKVIPLLINAIKELDEKYEEAKKELEKLKETL